MQTTGLSKNLNEMNKIKQWWQKLHTKEKAKLLQVDANLVIRQLQMSKTQRNSDCLCDVCKGIIKPTSKVITSKKKSFKI